MLSPALFAPRAARGEIVLPAPAAHLPITIAADAAHRWRQGAYDVWLLEGNCYLQQDLTYARSASAVLWVEHPDAYGRRPTKVIAYLEGNVRIDAQQPADAAGGKPARLTDTRWFGRFQTAAGLEFRTPPAATEPAVKPAIYGRGLARFDPQRASAIRRTQFVEPGAPGIVEQVPPPAAGALQPGMRRIRAFPRSNVPVQAQWFPGADGRESVAVIDSGVNLIVDGIENIGTIDLETDRLVIWTSATAADLGGASVQRDDLPLEVYMEGNIVFRQGGRVIYADRMYYDVAQQVGLVLNAELLTPVPEYAGLIRLKSGLLQQLDRENFVAHDALLTTSRLGVPRYAVESSTITFRDSRQPLLDPLTGGPQIDPATGEMLTTGDRLATAAGNRVTVGGVPVFAWPRLVTDLEKPSFYVNGVGVKNDSIFGTQLLVDLNLYQLLGCTNPPAGTDWELSLDYLSDRGFGYGTLFEYDRDGFLGLPGPAVGFLDAWFIRDRGKDDLGRDLMNLEPETKNRGRVLGRHRQQLPGGSQLIGQIGWISDRNFIESYYEDEWDEWKDQETSLEWKSVYDNREWSLLAEVQVNDFITDTSWLPRLDHYWLGESLAGDRLTWFEHSQAAYARMERTTIPTDATQREDFNFLPWEADVKGERFVTRQELDMPLEAGPVKVVPYALGELAHWGETLAAKDEQRFYYQVGARASLPMWAVDPTVCDPLFNLNGLAHKVVFEAEFAFAESNRDLDELPLYDPINDDAIEKFERRIPDTTFGGSPFTFDNAVPMRFDPRSYALRSGVASWVTSPTTEVADDLMVVRMGVHQRWQTKRGRPGARRIVDWMTFDVGGVWFPKEKRDNFGQDFGLVTYDFRWHLGDRFTLLSTGNFDFFSDGLRQITVGGFLTRPPRGSVYLGFRSLEGPISSNVLGVSYNYWMSPKWVSSVGATVDFGATGNIGESFSLTRIGESFLVGLRVNVDHGRDNVGVGLTFEPRFLSSLRTAQSTGVVIPPAGAYGLE